MPTPPVRTAPRTVMVRAVAVLAVAVLATACGGSGGSAAGDPIGAGAPRPVVHVDAHAVAGLGTVLVTGSGAVLYMFPPDGRHAVTCTGFCAGTWPPVRVAANGRTVAGPGARPALLGTVRDPDGGRVVTYNGWPLYTYAGDVDPYQATGQALDLDGAPWYVLRPTGDPLTRSVADS